MIDVQSLKNAYATERPDPTQRAQQVAFGTSGHRGSALSRTFNEAHVLAISQAVCDYRAQRGIDGPLFLGVDTHALSAPACETALEVLTANDVTVFVDRDGGYTPTPSVSLAILAHNAKPDANRADGIVISPSHNPPEDGGFKYNPPTGGPASSGVTSWIQDRANQILSDDFRGVRRAPVRGASREAKVAKYDFLNSYIRELPSIIDLEAIRAAGIRIGADPLGGASVAYWPEIADRYGLDLEVVSSEVDPTFHFMPVDWDGRIRMDCSSPHVMARLAESAGRFDLAFGNDPDADRHGIVTPGSGLVPPNHYLSVSVSYLLAHRPNWKRDAGIGKTVVTSAMIDRVAEDSGRSLFEVPVGFKWFVDGILDQTLAFACEESAGASFARKDGSVWTTEKDGLVLNLLAAEIMANTGRDLVALYDDLAGRFGRPEYRRIDVTATPEQKAALARLTPDDVTTKELAGDQITSKLTSAPSNGAAIGGLKVQTKRGWFAARPSGTEDVYKFYAESFADNDHLELLIEDGRQMVDAALTSD